MAGSAGRPAPPLPAPSARRRLPAPRPRRAAACPRPAPPLAAPGYDHYRHSA